MEVILFTTFCIVLAIPVIIIILRQREGRRKNLPPLKSGWIPWIGVAFDFGKEPLFYIHTTRKELGDIFTIKAAGKWMTFLCNHDDYQIFFHSQHASFGAAVQPFTQAVANVSKSSFFDHHTTLHDTVKSRLTPSYMSTLCQNLSRAFHSNILECVDKSGETEIDLMQFVRSSMFPPVVEELFGKDNLLLTKDEMLNAQNKFAKYDADFEYGVELPAIFLREWSDCKEWLLNIFSGVVGRIEDRKSPPERLVEHLISAVDHPNASGYSLLLLWASQANAIPISFWTLAYILSNLNVLATIRQELQDWSLDLTGEVQESSLKSIPSIKRAILESMRLRAPGMITRKVTEPITVKGYMIPAGHMLMLSPYWSHRNSDYFPDAESFKPDRWTSCDIDKGQYLPGFVAFGGGRYQCPGRWFAMMEMHLYIAMVLKILDITILDPVPEPSPLHLVGSQQPIKPCHIKITKQKV